MNPAEHSVAKRKPETAEDLLDREEALAVERITVSLQNMGEDLCVAADLRARIQRHPLLATGICAGVGFFASPFLGRAGSRLFAASAGLRKSAAAQSHHLPELLVASLRGMRDLR